FTGVLLLLAPAFTLRTMGLHVPDDALPFLSFIGAFVFSVGLACLYGFLAMVRREKPCRIEIVWLLTAFPRAGVASFVFAQVISHALEAGWLTVAISDAVCVVIQGIGLRKGWLAHV